MQVSNSKKATKTKNDKTVKSILNRNKVSSGSFSISEGFPLIHSFCHLIEGYACVSAGSGTLLQCSIITSLIARGSEHWRTGVTSSGVKIRVVHYGQLVLLAMPHPWASGVMPSPRDTTEGKPWAKGLLFLCSNEAFPLESGLMYFCSHQQPNFHAEWASSVTGNPPGDVTTNYPQHN